MINYIKGNILDITEGIIVQQVNCMGVMGAGLAKQIRDKWPDVYYEYKETLTFIPHAKDLLGACCWTKVNKNSSDYLYVASIFGQYNYGYKTKYTIYPALLEGLEWIFRIT